MVKGYKADGGYVVMGEEDFDHAERATSRAIDVIHGDEVREFDAHWSHRKPDAREVEFAEQYVEVLTKPFAPETYHDEYREKLLTIIEAKAEGEEIALPEAPKPNGKVVNLMAGLGAGRPASPAPRRCPGALVPPSRARVHWGEPRRSGGRGLFRECAWCGIFIGVTLPVGDETVTHGICARCTERVQREATGRGRHAVIVVRRSHDTVYRHLTEVFRHLNWVSVRLDRRRIERRRERSGIGMDRRREERRHLPLRSEEESWSAIGIKVVYTEPPGR